MRMTRCVLFEEFPRCGEIPTVSCQLPTDPYVVRSQPYGQLRSAANKFIERVVPVIWSAACPVHSLAPPSHND